MSLMPQASAPVTSSISTAGDWLTSDTRTLPLTSTSVALVCCAMNSTGPIVKLLPCLNAFTTTSFLLKPQSSCTAAVNCTLNVHAWSTAPPSASIDATGGVGTTLKLLFETSKKTLPTPEALRRAWPVAVHGAIGLAAPSLAVGPNSGLKALPPLEEKPRSTRLATLPPPTVHVVGIVHPSPITSPPFGLVMKKGALDTVSTASSLEIPPPPARLSRAVSRNVIVRSVTGRNSPFHTVLERMSVRFGNTRTSPSAVGGTDRKSGPSPGSVLMLRGPDATSYCSHVNNKPSPSGSLPLPVNSNGVPLGMV